MFGIKVECSGRSGGYRYYLKKDSVKCDDVTEWLLSSLRLASLGDMLQYHTKVMLDPAATQLRIARRHPQSHRQAISAEV